MDWRYVVLLLEIITQSPERLTVEKKKIVREFLKHGLKYDNRPPDSQECLTSHIPEVPQLYLDWTRIYWKQEYNGGIFGKKTLFGMLRAYMELKDDYRRSPNRRLSLRLRKKRV